MHSGAVGMTSSGLPISQAHDFSKVPAVTHPRSTFDRTSKRKMTFDPNVLFPCFTDQQYPGDTLQVSAGLFGRLLAPLKFPIMDNYFLDWFAFFVPYRLLWTNWIHMMGEQNSPGDPIPTAYTVPTMVPSGTPTLHSLADYFGHLGATLANTVAGVSCFKYRAYNKIFFDWFRNQNFVDAPNLYVGDDPESMDVYPIRTRIKRPDMFVSMLPFAQKFAASEVTVTGGTFGVTVPTDIDTGRWASDSSTFNFFAPPGASGPGSPIYGTPNTTSVAPDSFALVMPQDMTVSIPGGIFNINELRLGITMQQLAEIDMRSGTRYIESNLAHFGVLSPDARLQRSEYLGGGTIQINTNPVASTAGNGTGGTLAQLGAFGTLGGNVQFTGSFTEHGVVMVIAEARAELTYWQGIDHEDVSEHSRYDYYFPVFANIGEQPYLSKEIYADGSTDDQLVFGYQEPYAHLRYKPSKLMGYFRPDAPGSLDFMHLAQDFADRPLLNEEFLNEDMPIERVVTSASSPYFILDSLWAVRHTRVLPMFGVPGLHRL